MSQPSLDIRTSQSLSGVLGRAADYTALAKLRPMSAVIYSAAVGHVCAPLSATLANGIAAVACIAAGGFGAAALNMWYEADSDARMRRTVRRPLPAGRLDTREALGFGLVLASGSVAGMWLVAGVVAAAMLTATIFAYFGLYTVALKHRTRHSVLLGGALAGVLTPLTGWAAAGGPLGWQALAMFAFVFAWTPPHVWAQAIYRSRDYAAAGVPMLPVVAGSAAARRWIFRFTVLHSTLALLPAALGLAGLAHGVIAAAAGLWLTGLAFLLSRMTDDAAADHAARRFFRSSIAYVLIVLTAMAVEHGLDLFVSVPGLFA